MLLDEKVNNLSRLWKLSQTLQSEKEAELRQCNEELRTQLTLLHRQHTELQLVVEQQQQQITQSNADVQLLRDELAAFRRVVVGQEQTNEVLHSAVQEVSRGVAELKNQCGQIELTARHQATVLSETTEMATTEIGSTRVWMKRNLERLKERLKHIQVDVCGLKGVRAMAGFHQLTQDDYEKSHRLSALLMQASTEVEAVTQSIDVELQRHATVSPVV